MRLSCPHCGARDRREFTYQASGEGLSRPEGGDWDEAWHAYLHLRRNPAGEEDELWSHDPCGTWLVIRRNRTTHEVVSVREARA